MPSQSKAQQRLMGAAEHGADFPMAQKLRASMTHQQLHDFASGSEKGKPEHVSKKGKKAIHSARGRFSAGRGMDGHGSPLSTAPKVLRNPRSLKGRRAAAHAAAYPSDVDE